MIKMPNQVKRHTAYKIRIKDIISSPYKKEEGEWEPNYLAIGDKKVSRVNLIAVVVSKNEGQNQQNILVDDGSEKIMVRPFEGNGLPEDIILGTIILIIGRPREFNNERYIIPELIKKINDKRWIDLRKKELTLKHDPETVENKNELIKDEIEANPTKKYKEILDKIKELDSGHGADSEIIIEEYGTGTEDIIHNLLENGEIFEIKPGKIKILE